MSMKITDIHVMESQYNQANNIPDIIANLKYPQKYLKLRLDDKLYDLELVETHDDKFILEIEQKRVNDYD